MADRNILERFRKDFGITEPVTDVLTTHKHPDYSGANEDLEITYPAMRVSGGLDDKVPGTTRKVHDGDQFPMFDGSVYYKCFSDLKGHTLYYCYQPENFEEAEHKCEMKGKYMIVSNIDRCAFTGDAAQIGNYARAYRDKLEKPKGHGCWLPDEHGRVQPVWVPEDEPDKDRFAGVSPLFGKAPEMKAMDIIMCMPDETKIFSGHQYTRANFAFGVKAEPSNPKISEFREKYA